MIRDGELTIKEAAEILEISIWTAKRWAYAALANRKSKLTGVRKDLAGRIYVQERAVLALLDSHATVARV